MDKLKRDMDEVVISSMDFTDSDGVIRDFINVSSVLHGYRHPQESEGMSEERYKEAWREVVDRVTDAMGIGARLVRVGLGKRLGLRVKELREKYSELDTEDMIRSGMSQLDSDYEQRLEFLRNRVSGLVRREKLELGVKLGAGYGIEQGVGGFQMSLQQKVMVLTSFMLMPLVYVDASRGMEDSLRDGVNKIRERIKNISSATLYAEQVWLNRSGDLEEGSGYNRGI